MVTLLTQVYYHHLSYLSTYPTYPRLILPRFCLTRAYKKPALPTNQKKDGWLSACFLFVDEARLALLVQPPAPFPSYTSLARSAGSGRRLLPRSGRLARLEFLLALSHRSRRALSFRPDSSAAPSRNCPGAAGIESAAAKELSSLGAATKLGAKATLLALMHAKAFAF